MWLPRMATVFATSSTVSADGSINDRIILADVGSTQLDLCQLNRSEIVMGRKDKCTHVGQKLTWL